MNFDLVMNVVAAIAVCGMLVGAALLMIALGIFAIRLALRFGRKPDDQVQRAPTS